MNHEYLSTVAFHLRGHGPCETLTWAVRDVPNEEMRKDHARLVGLRVDGLDSGAELSVWLGRPNGSSGERFVVHPVWPRTARDYYRPRDPVNEITVTGSASPERLGAEINRRLLNLYFEQLAQALASIERDRLAWETRRSLAAAVSRAWGVPIRPYPNRDPETDEELRLHLPHSDTFDAEVVVRPYAGAKFTVTLKDPAQVKVLADVLLHLWEAKEPGEGLPEELRA